MAHRLERPERGGGRTQGTRGTGTPQNLTRSTGKRFRRSLDSFYPGLNALSLLTLAVELAKANPEVWESRFDTEEQAKAELDSLQIQRQNLVGAVGMSFDAEKKRLQQTGKTDRWVDIGLADYLFLTSKKPMKVAFAYRSALAGAPDFYFDSARAQIELFRRPWRTDRKHGSGDQGVQIYCTARRKSNLAASCCSQVI